ncbi:hypothetical protein M6D93_18465 [Jatrophihabitans telluris]|uniref:Maltokinase N-terminal cap domain-containing protein n=1 Tax=Jatrophihabitans telluris TaxID=2038343 RepID=A0ABY4QX60_9ACTN|nr:hypothetical protein [Jatrophihabitans telluris]UQX88248.1 hypothetical protein M6D93_18465 [Jatrophihabitans telluris]
MAVIHNTTLTPTKLELLTAWLPDQPWYQAVDAAPELSRAGGFRLDDPAGQVGIEFMLVVDVATGAAVSYLVPLSYRSERLHPDGVGLIGTTQHGVLGQRWVHDGAHDPVVAAQLLALLQRQAEPQSQSISNTTEPTVIAEFFAPPPIVAHRFSVSEGRQGTEIRAEALDGTAVSMRLERRPRPGSDVDAEADALGRLTGGWTLPDASAVRGLLATSHAG